MPTLKPAIVRQVRVMSGFAILKRSEHQRPFWLTVALSVMLLVSVSITMAQAANPARLAHELRRDLGALRAQLELIDPSERDAGRQTVAFNTDLGDGGPVFQRHSMVTIAAAANRRVERLLESDRAQGGDARGRCRGVSAYARCTICSARSISWRAPRVLPRRRRCGRASWRCWIAASGS